MCGDKASNKVLASLRFLGLELRFNCAHTSRQTSFIFLSMLGKRGNARQNASKSFWLGQQVWSVYGPKMFPLEI